MIKLNTIYHCEWMYLLTIIPNDYVDLIIIDPPYVLTKEDWDVEAVNEHLSDKLNRVLKSTGSLYVWCGIGEQSQSLLRWFPIFDRHFHFKDLITWKKNRGIGMRRGWLYTREEIMWFVKDKKRFVWNKENQYSKEKRAFDVVRKGGVPVNKSKYKRITNVWSDINEVGYGSSPKKYKEIKDEIEHYTPKPVEAYERIIKAHTEENDIVMDCFGGSGTVIGACKNTNRNWIYSDKDIKSVNIAKKLYL